MIKNNKAILGRSTDLAQIWFAESMYLDILTDTILV